MNAFDYQNGEMFVDSLAVSEIAKSVGTPFYIYSQSEICNCFNAFEKAAKKRLKDFLICFAIKSNANPAILKLLASMGAGADVVSKEELLLALKSGIAANKIVFSGVGKTEEELALAVEHDIRQVNIESEEEAATLNEIAVSKGKKIKAAIRINPDVDAHTHQKITTGKKENKFGINWEKALSLYQIFSKSNGLDLSGIDLHIGSQLLELTPFEQAFKRTSELIRLLKEHSIKIQTIDVGGGLGVVYNEKDAPVDPDTYMQIVHDAFADFDGSIIFEPGRFLLASGGALIARNVRIKKADEKNFLVLDAGMNDLIRPAMYDAYHEILSVKAGVCDQTYDIVGPICESSDIFGKDRRLPLMDEGDLVIVKTAGAYGFSMASNYNCRPLCAEVLVHKNRYALIRRRQTLENMLLLTREPEWL